MPSQIASSSWHPAFMPNSDADIIAPKPSESSIPTHDRIDTHKPDSVPASNLEAQIAEGEILEEKDNLIDSHSDNAAHPELSNLRNALSTSLASPGGVELAESPFHNGVVHQDTIEELKGDFPSAGPSPAHGNKHSSTMSFARTISEEVNLEDDEVDPVWNLQRIETDPFKLMNEPARTNSFPQVPPAHARGPSLDLPLPLSQAEDIMQEMQREPRDMFADEGNDGDADFFSQTASHEEGFPPDTLAEVKHGLNDFGRAFGGEVRQDDDQDSQARYEEGLPLFQASEHHIEQPSQKNPAAFMDDEGDEDGFFTQVSKSDQILPEPSQPTTLERKSTMQVMDSLHFQPYEQKQDFLEEEAIEENMESSIRSLKKSTGGGIGVSTSTILSEVLGDPSASIYDQPEKSADLQIDSGDGDLAEKWKAALAGDEFLDDDDDLLLDDEEKPAEKTLDPADLFGSDDEGFLEDIDDSNNPTDFLSQYTSTPIPAPVTGSNEQMQGPDSLTSGVQTSRPSSSSNRYLPTGAGTSVPSSTNDYAPPAPLLTDLSHSTPTAQSAYSSPQTPAWAPHQQQPQPQRPELPKAQSFANQSKGGYASPYDLPMEVVKPRKRPSAQVLNRGPSASLPPSNNAPPRASSLYPQASVPSRTPTTSMSPSQSSHSQQPTNLPPKTVRKTQSAFFEDLPMSNRPKPAARHTSSYGSPAVSPYGPPGTIPPQQTPYGPSDAAPPQQAPGPSQYAPPVQAPSKSSSVPNLIAPERMSPYASLPSGTTLPPATSARYSPAPPLAQSQTAPPPPVAQSRYSPAPPAQRQAPTYSTTPINAAAPSVLAHQPRTSSPLAHFERNQEPRHTSYSEGTSYDRRTSSSGFESNLRTIHLPPTHEVDETDHAMNGAQKPPSPGMRAASHTPPTPQSFASKISSPPKRTMSSYMPQQPANEHNPPQAFLPPKRSQTQSPGTAFAGPRLEMSNSDPYQRPASTEVPLSPRVNTGFSAMPAITSRPRGFSQGLNYVSPTDGRENDSLQRWRGSPVFVWGVGGTVITSFPKDVPRYGLGQTVPLIIRSPGEVKTRNIRDIDPLPDHLTSFPGPLKGKSKKKEVVSWLTSGIETLERDAAYLRSIPHLSHDDKRKEERILLWKILRVFIENDGMLEDNAVVEKAVRAVLSPGIDNDDSTAPLYATGAELSGISSSSTSGTRADPVDPLAVEQLRKFLLRGEREKAVWEAVDKRLWAHAMLISNTVSKDLYKQVAQEFVQKEVKNIGDNTESLAALYEIFAGNFEESIDELVPPSARAGFQMVSTTNTSGPSRGALDGLDRWRETLGLVLSNRSTDDSKALDALGKLLSGYGRAEAAHICFLFARSHTVFGGIDDPQATFVLVGADQLRQPYEFDREMEPILLSEVFEYGMALSNTSNIAISSPHLSVYKLQHATILAEYGYRDNAMQYCEAIASSITSQTRRSPYHHALLVSALDDLSKRLKQSPKDENSSWISKPSIDKVSGSVWATFNKFVAGDENDAATAAGSATASGGEIGPFARIAGGTPTISPSPSQSDLYGSYPGGAVANGSIPISATKAASRYAPGGSYTPEPQIGSSFNSQPHKSVDEMYPMANRQFAPQRQTSDYRPSSHSSTNYAPQSSSGFTPQTPNFAQADHAANYGSPYTPQISTPITEQPPSNIYSSPEALQSFDGQQQQSYNSEPSYISNHPSGYEPPTSSGYETPSNSYEPLSSSVYEPPSSGSYEPPTSSDYEPFSGGYEPPTSSTYEPEPDSPLETRPKKKSFMDDDDDDIPALKQQPTAREKTKAEKDREADDAFRKAAEADAAKASAAPPTKKGWGLGGWFGGAKKEASQDMSQPNKPIRAKLGEASSFVYDPELKRWVNKKGGDTAPTPSATPPPPRAAPPRAMSGPPGAVRPAPTSVPPMGSENPQRAVSEMGSAPLMRQESTSSLYDSGGLGPPAAMRSVSNGSGPPSAPPSRPGTGMSNASSIDDLLGPPTARKGAKGAASKGKKKGRGYVDVMGEKGVGA